MVDHAIGQLRGTVWALHAIPLEGRSLPEAIETLARRLGNGQPAAITVTYAGAAAAVPEPVSGSLLLVTQEAIRNALTHARPTRIDIHVDVGGDGRCVGIRIRDDGAGFVPGEQPGASRGHFGLEGMRDRVQLLGGTLGVQSRLGEGTMIEVRVPLDEGAAEAAVPPVPRTTGATLDEMSPEDAPHP
jgi:signal transduction histidine kinase